MYHRFNRLLIMAPLPFSHLINSLYHFINVFRIIRINIREQCLLQRIVSAGNAPNRRQFFRAAFKQTTGIDIFGNLTDKIINAANLMQVGAV